MVRKRVSRVWFVVGTVLGMIFLGMIVTGFSILFPEFQHPLVLIGGGLIGLSLVGWFGFGLLSKR